MLAAYGFAEVDVFSIPSCIIVTVNDENGHALTRIKRNRSSSLDFDRIDKLNNLCRHVCTERPPLEQIRASLDAIMGKKDYSFWTRLFFTASISASFTLFYGGNFQDSFASFFIGILLFLLLSLLGNFGTNSFFQNIFGSALVAGLSVWTTAMGWTVNYDKMIIGTRTKEHPAVALYKSYNLVQWTYCQEIFEAKQEEGCFPLECPDLYKLDNQWVLTAGYCGHVDAHGRKNGTYYHIGEWYQDQFHAETQGLYDFGADFYAVQTIDTEIGRVAIGWISDVSKEHVKSVNGACGSMSIPRVLHVKDGRLYQNPIRGIYQLIRYPVYEGCDEDVELSGIEGNTYYVRLELETPADFRMTLYKWKDRKLYLEKKDGQCRFRTVGEGAKNILYPADIDQVTVVEVFVDRNVCEVFLNEGQAAGAKKFYQQSEMGNFEFHAQEKGAVKSLMVEKMEGIW